MKKKWITTTAVSLLTAVILSACTPQSDEKNRSGEKISVVTSFYPMYEFTKQVAGDRADVWMMVAAGEDAHHYEPSAKDVAGVNQADVFVYSSEEMEHWARSLLNTIEKKDLVIARTIDGLDTYMEVGNKNDENPETAEEITILGVSDHYHTGDHIKLRAKSKDKNHDRWEWFTRENETAQWEPVTNQEGPNFKLQAPKASFEIQAVLYDDSHKEYAESKPIEILIDNHDGNVHSNKDKNQQHNATSEQIEIIGLAGHYHTGDVVTLIGQSEEEPTNANWKWLMRSNLESEWETVTGQESNRFEYKTTGESFELRAVLYNQANKTVAESEPVSVLIDDHENQDPHIWLDPLYAQAQVNVIRDALIKADPEGTATYEKNAQNFSEELQTLHEDYEKTLQLAENRKFVVQHEAFGYLAKRYQLEQIAIGGLSTEVEPSPSRIAEIKQLVSKYEVPVIYYQQGESSAIAETVAIETNTQTAVLYDLEVLSEELQAEKLGYIEAMRKNLENLQLSIR